MGMDADTSAAQLQYRRQLEQNQRLQEHLERTGRQAKAAVPSLAPSDFTALPNSLPLPPKEESRPPSASAPEETTPLVFGAPPGGGDSPKAVVSFGAVEPLQHRWPYSEGPVALTRSSLSGAG